MTEPNEELFDRIRESVAEKDKPLPDIDERFGKQPGEQSRWSELANKSASRTRSDKGDKQ